MANPRRSVRSLSLSRRWVLLLLSVFVLYFLQLQITFHNSQILQHADTGFQSAAIVFNLHPKYPTVPATKRPSRWLRTLLERDLKRLGSKAAKISAAKRAALAVNNPSVLLFVEGNVYPDGLYYAEVNIGKRAKTFFLDIDTGSELTWLQCDAPCRSCGKGPNGLYNGKKALVVDCLHPICPNVQHGQPYECKEDLNGRWTQCDYRVEYADTSYTNGALVADFLTLLLSNGSQWRTDFIFGCGYNQHGGLAKDPMLTDGVMGLSNTEATLLSQLEQDGVVKNVIGQCLGSNGGDHLFFEEGLVPTSGMMWVPMNGFLNNQYSHYQACLRRILYGPDELNMKGAIDDVLFDSGATFTYFVPQIYHAVHKAVLAQAKNWKLVRDKNDPTLPFCWRDSLTFAFAPLNYNQYFKAISLDFGSNNIFVLKPEGYLLTSVRNMYKTSEQ